MKIAITGATGNIGSELVKTMLARQTGDEIVVLVRHPDKLPADVRGAVTVAQGDLHDAGFVQSATVGAGSLFWLTPPVFTTPDWPAYYAAMASVASGAVKANGIGHVVHVSSAGAHLPDAGPVTLLHEIEKALDATGANTVHLRAGFFFENFLQQIEPIATAGAMFYPVRGDVAYPYVATRDIAQVAAARLADPSWTGRIIQGVHGPADETLNHAAEVFTQVLGRPVHLVTIPFDQAREQVIGMGASPSVADGYMDMQRTLDRGDKPAEPRTPETTTPTTLETWAREVLLPAVTARLAQ